MNKHLALLLLRLAFGFRLIWGTWDNIISYDRMLEFRDFLDQNGFPLPLVSAILSVYLQFISGISWIIGFKVKIFSIVMILNFLVALIGVHIGDTYQNSFPAIHMLVISVFLAVTGPGKLSVDDRL